MLPLPSWPELLLPQVRTEPSDFRAILCVVAPDIPITPLPVPRPTTGTGALAFVMRGPLPSWPTLLVPQAPTEPSDFKARLCCEPAMIAVAPLPDPRLLT